MDALIRAFESTGKFSGVEGNGSATVVPQNDRVRYFVHANRVLVRAQLSAVTAVMQSVPLGETWVATALRITNTDSVARTVTIRDVPYGGTSIAQYDWISALSVNAGETIYLYGIEDVWEGGYTIYAHASVANVVNLKIMGMPLLDS